MTDYEFLQIKEMIEQNAFRKSLPSKIVAGVLIALALAIFLFLGASECFLGFVTLTDKQFMGLSYLALTMIGISAVIGLVTWAFDDKKEKEHSELFSAWQESKKQTSGEPDLKQYPRLKKYFEIED